MPHYVPAGGSGLAHGLVLADLKKIAGAQAAMNAINALKVAGLSIQAISHFEDPAGPNGQPRPPGDRIGVFVNSTQPLGSAAAHTLLATLEADIEALGYFTQTEHY